MKPHSVVLVVVLLSALPSVAADETALERDRQERHQRQKDLEAMDLASVVRLFEADPADFQLQQAILQRGQAAAPLLIRIVESPGAKNAANAVLLLGEMRSEPAIAAIAAYAKAQGHKSEIAERALGRIGGPVAASYLLDALSQAPPNTQREIMLSLAAIGDNRAVEPMAVVLLDPNREVRTRRDAIQALERFSDPRGRAALEVAVEKDADWYVYYEAKCALGKIGATRPGISANESSNLLIKRMYRTPIPPDGIDGFLDRHRRQVAPSARVFFIEDYLPQEEIDRARDQLIEDARRGPAEPIVEVLMYRYLGNRKESKRKAEEFLREIGSAATPALLNGIKRGDSFLAADCRRCLSN